MVSSDPHGSRLLPDTVAAVRVLLQDCSPMVDSSISGSPRHFARAQDARRLAGRARRDPGVCNRLRCALLWGLLVIGAASSEAQSPVKQVLILQSLDRGNLVLDQFTGEFRVNLDQRVARPVNVVQVVVGQRGFVTAPEQAIVEYVRSMYADRPPPDLIVTTGGPAAVFGRKYRQELFPGTAPPFRLGGLAIPPRRASWRERDCGLGRQRFSSTDR